MVNNIVTGMGVVSTAGFNLDDFWNTLKEGKITYGIIPEFENDSNYRIQSWLILSLF